MNKQLKILKSDYQIDQIEFDAWHKKTLYFIINDFKSYEKITVGQVQKWINMTFKYLAMRDYKDFENIYQFCHVPIDSTILNIVKNDLFKKWSEINDYDKYLDFQKLFRNKNITQLKKVLKCEIGEGEMDKLYPLIIENKIWLYEKLKQKEKVNTIYWKNQNLV